MNFTVMQHGKPLSKELYNWDEKTKTFSTSETNVAIDFSGYDNVTFKTTSLAFIRSGSDCTFDTGSNCHFIAANRCIFKTGSNCTFDVGNDCHFKTDSHCHFKTGSHCNFETWDDCVFDVDSFCVFDVCFSCVVIERSTFRVTHIPANKTVMLDNETDEGYKLIYPSTT